MNRFAFNLIAIVFLTGCDAISLTEVKLGPQHTDGSSITTHEVVGIATKTAAEFGLEEIERRDTDTSFSDSRSRFGQNPELWITIKHSPHPTGIEIVESYIANPTDKHKRLAQSLVHDLNAGGFIASIVYQTPDPHRWPWLIGPANLTAAFIAWRFRRNRNIKKHRENAT
jgi:hypothetical protein